MVMEIKARPEFTHVQPITEYTRMTLWRRTTQPLNQTLCFQKPGPRAQRHASRPCLSTTFPGSQFKGVQERPCIMLPGKVNLGHLPTVCQSRILGSDGLPCGAGYCASSTLSSNTQLLPSFSSCGASVRNTAGRAGRIVRGAVAPPSLLVPL